MTSGKAAAAKLIERSTDDDFLVCRSIGHKFNEATSRVERVKGRFNWTMDCARCGTSRTKILSTQGRILGSNYKYPEKYTAPGIGRLDASGQGHLRIFVLMNVLGGLS